MGGDFFVDYELNLKAFKNYLKQFDLTSEEISLKVSHSYHVAHLASILAKRLELNEEEIQFAKTLGLLHDVGRFIQFTKAKEYNDYKTHLDHGALGVDYLFKEGHIKDFSINEDYYSILEIAIRNHNQLDIEKGLQKQALFWTQFIRDVDKIDIYRVIASHFESQFSEEASLTVQDSFFKHTLIKLEAIQNESDTILQNLAFVYDLNFKESFLLLEETDNLELYISHLQVDKNLEDVFKSYIKEVRTFLESKINEN